MKHLKTAAQGIGAATVLMLGVVAGPAVAQQLPEQPINGTCYAMVIADHFDDISTETPPDERFDTLSRTLGARERCLSREHLNHCADTESWADSIACHTSSADAAEKQVLALATSPLPPVLLGLRTQVLAETDYSCAPLGPPPARFVSAEEAEIMCRMRANLILAGVLAALEQIGAETPELWDTDE